MARSTFQPKDFEQMTALQRKVAEVLLRANREGVDRVIAAFALMRLVRELMDGVEANARQALISQVLVPFLEGEKPEGEGGRIITLH